MNLRLAARRWLVGIEAVTGALAAVGGFLLLVRPDGSLIGANTDVLAGSPFTSWRVPGALLLTLVGGGFTGTALYVSASGRFAAALSVIAGAGLIVFESCEVIWLGLQPLEIVFMAVGVAVAGLGLGLNRGGFVRPLSHQSAAHQPAEKTQWSEHHERIDVPRRTG